MPRTELLPWMRSSALLSAAVCTAALLAAPAYAGPTRISINVGVEIETRGPVHEAFAEPVVYTPEPCPVVPQEPPPPIDEMLPDERPEGDGVTWIPGYWGWDDDRNDYLWVSGVWRNLPPDRQFIPGYWARVHGGYQWVPGSWLSVSTQTLDYLPEPPPPLSVQPVGPPPAFNDIWVPGIWLWQHGRYVWRPGYWLTPKVDWIWIPAHYIWTPSGYLYVSGYWDYAVKRRGVLFAPAHIQRTVLARADFVYRPTIVVESGMLIDHLFTRARYCHYVFGDYYAAEYQRVGILPVYRFHGSVHGYSPLYAQTLAVHRRSDPEWEHRYIREYETRRDHPDARPPRTWATLERVRGERRPGHDDPRSRTLAFVRPLSELTTSRDTQDVPFRFQRLGSGQRDSYRRENANLRDYQTKRSHLESSWADKSPLRSSPGGQDSRARADERSQRPQPGQARDRSTGVKRQDGSLQLNLPRSPIANRQGWGLFKPSGPPAQPTAPKVDPNARPAPRVQPRERTQTSGVTRGSAQPSNKDRDKDKDQDKDKGRDVRSRGRS